MSDKRPLPSDILKEDVNAMNALNQVPAYNPPNAKVTPEALQQSYEDMVSKQQFAEEQQAIAKAALEAARQAEYDFHDSVLTMRQAVRGQFGADSKEAEKMGYTRTSDRKPPKPKDPNSKPND
jgi:hypothetical protein